MNPVYDVDGIQIWHADCADVLPLIDPATVGLLLTDPPYGIGLDTNYAARLPDAIDWDREIVADDTPFDPQHLVKYGRLVLWGANNYSQTLPRGGWIVWDKGFRSQRDVRSECEMAWTNVTRRLRMVNVQWIGAVRGDERGSSLHPTQKPVALMRWIVEQWTEPGDLVLDPYMGSGPVARACADLGRRYIGIEIVEEYVDAAIGRLGQLTLDVN